jgi:hypothetical protein
MSKRAMAPIEDRRLRIDDSLERIFRMDVQMTTAERLQALDRMSDDEVMMLSRKVIDPNDEDDPEVDPDDDGEKEETDDPEGEAEKDRADEEGDDSGDDDGGEDDDRMADTYVMSGYRRPAIPNRYSVLRRRR